jgi:hypothetical protein
MLIGLPARTATVERESLVAPPRRGGYAFASAEGFVLAAGGSMIGGSLGGGYVASPSVRLEAGLQDFGVATARGQTSSSGLLLIYTGLDSHLLGFGPSAGYFWRDRLRMPIVGGALRIGASDGLHGQLQLGYGIKPLPTLSSSDDPPEEERTSTELSIIDFRLQVPIARGGRAFVTTFDISEGPVARLAFGYRLCLSDARRRDSIWLEVKGGAGVMDTTFAGTCSDCEEIAFGPFLSVAVENRF